MTPTDRKIQIMNRAYASNVQRLTAEIIELKMEIVRLHELYGTPKKDDYYGRKQDNEL